MEVIDLSIELLKEATWNVNQIDEAMMQRLTSSIQRYGLVQNLVVRHVVDGYEVLSGNQRLKLFQRAQGINGPLRNCEPGRCPCPTSRPGLEPCPW